MFNYQRAICYSGYRKGQGPNIHIYPNYEQVKEDLFILQDKFDIIRMYDPYDHAKTVLECIRAENLNLKVMLGMDLAAEYSNLGCPWLQQNLSEEEIARNKQYNNQSLAELIKLANEYSDIIVFVAAGNEARPSWGDNLVEEDRIVYFIEELKKNCPQPVSYCEGYDLWLGQMNKIVKSVDFLSVHIYPLWNKIPFDEAVSYTITRFEEVVKSTTKPVIITEMGWATSCLTGQMIKEDATIENQQKYILELNKYLKETNRLGFFFEAFDEPWKGGNNPAEAEKNWGIYFLDRTGKW